MDKVKFRLNKKGVGDILKGNGARNVCRSCAEKIQANVGDGWVLGEFTTAQRVGVSVKADTPQAYYSNLKHNKLEQAIGTVRK